MKVALICALLCVPAAAQAAPPPVAGHWEGAIELPNMEIQVMIDLTPAESGWTGAIESRPGPRGVMLDKIAAAATRALCIAA